MKLKLRIQLIMCAAQIFIVLIMGIGVGFVSYKEVQNLVCDSVETGAEEASAHISQQMKDYLDAVRIAGLSDVLNSDATVDEKVKYLNDFVEVFGFVSGNILDKNGVSIKDGEKFADREYVQKALKGEANVSEVTLSKYTNTYGVSIAAPIMDENNKINGVVYFRMDIDFLLDVIGGIDFSSNSYAYLVNQEGTVIVHPNQELILNTDPDLKPTKVQEIIDSAKEGKASSGEYTYNGKRVYCGACTIENTNDWSIVICAPREDFLAASVALQRWICILGAVSLVLVFSLSAIIARYVCAPITQVKDALVSVAEGDFKVSVKDSTGKDEISVLLHTTNKLVNTLKTIIGEANVVLGRIANSDLSGSNMSSYPGDFNKLANSVNEIKMNLSRLIIEVQNAVVSVDNGSRELAEATAALSQGTVQQASSIQTLADDMKAVVEKINRNSESGTVVNNKLSDLDTEIHSANDQMHKLLDAVAEIETMSSSIQKIVATIDAIAFQTNILSLNASVEAARAGDMGSGFAVVAEEVRALAEKCSESSKKTSELVTKCINSIDYAKKCADATFENLSDIVEQSTEIAGAFETISQDTVEQAEKSKHIQAEVNVISDVVQTNTATVEETAASTAVLSEQASNLEEMIKHFKVN